MRQPSLVRPNCIQASLLWQYRTFAQCASDRGKIRKHAYLSGDLDSNFTSRKNYSANMAEPVSSMNNAPQFRILLARSTQPTTRSSHGNAISAQRLSPWLAVSSAQLLLPLHLPIRQRFLQPVSNPLLCNLPSLTRRWIPREIGETRRKLGARAQHFITPPQV